MTASEVRGVLGNPAAEVVFGAKTQWTYPGVKVLFVSGKVADVVF
jgi:hypothetical protein